LLGKLLRRSGRSRRTQTGLSHSEPTLSPQAFEAYNLYLKGQYFWNKRSLLEATSYFEQATAKDPNFCARLCRFGRLLRSDRRLHGAPAAEFAPQARTAALRALQLDDRLPEAHAALALIVQNYDYDWQTAEKNSKGRLS